MRFFKLEQSYSYDSQVFGNPLMGYAPCAWYEEVADDVNLLYMDITWRELEPEEGVFDWDGIEKENRLDHWRKEGKHIVLRFVCDIPDDQEHMDIPDWLYEKIDGAGMSYHTSYGYGFSPDYNNKTFMEYHSKAVAALGERYGGDGFISYVELGSLGHWGEWHVKYSAGIPRLPVTELRENYVKPWIDAFPHAHIMMRRPFAEAKKYGLGLFNDMAGHHDSTMEWLDWIANGGEYSQTGEKDAIVPLPDCWKTAPIGGELTSSLEMEEMLTHNAEATADLIGTSHTTFLGPKIAEREYPGYDTVLSKMGYRLWISKATLTPAFLNGIHVTLTWQNSGVAPLYEDWPVYLYLRNQEGTLVHTIPLDLRLSELLPGTTVKTKVKLNGKISWSDRRNYTFSVGIVDPMTEKNAVRLANEGAEGAEFVLFSAKKP